MRPKHILFIVENNPVPRDVRVWAEARTAKELGYRVSVICPRDRRSRDRRTVIDGIRLHRHALPFEGRGIVGLLLEYANALVMEIFLSVRLYLAEPFHCIHAANPPDHLFVIGLLFKLVGVKYLFDHHDVSPEGFVAKFGRKGLFYRLLLLMEWLTFKTADRVVSTNESYRGIAVSRGGKRREDVFVVRNGPDLSRIPPGTVNDSLRHGFQYLVGYVGIIGQQEGIENLIASVSCIVHERNRHDVGFIVVGSGPHWEHVVRLTRNLGLGSYIRFTGYIADSCLYEVLSTVDVCINPEFRNDFTNVSTMIKVMEYMTFSKPVIQFYTTEGEVTAGDAAHYVRNNSHQELADELIALLDDEPRRKRMAQAGRRRIEEKLCWDRQKTNLARAYESLLG